MAIIDIGREAGTLISKLIRGLRRGRAAEGYPGKGILRRPEPLRKAVVDGGSCQRCGNCEQRCHYRRIRLPRKGPAIVLPGCVGCGACRNACPHGAVRMVPTGSALEGRA